MEGIEYQRKLNGALEYIEDNLEADLTLNDLAARASYSPGHLIWIFRAVTGYTPMEYVRRRRMTEAARAILAGEDIVQAVYRFGFSAQDAFTRSFRNEIGLTPGRLRKTGIDKGTYTPAFKTAQKGGNRMINYQLDCDPLETVLRVEHLLSDEVKELVGRIAREKAYLRDIDPHISSELEEARIVRHVGNEVFVDTAVFLEDDLLRIYPVAEKWGTEFAGRVMALKNWLPNMPSGIKRLVIGMNGIDQGVFQLLISGGYAFNHRATGGRYAGAKIDFYEVCDAYDRFGPYLSGGYGFHGQRFAVKIIGQDQGIYAYLNAGIGLEDKELFEFRTYVNEYLVDSLGGMIRGEISDPSLSAAAEAAGLLKSGKPLVSFITDAEAPAYSKAVGLVRDVIAEFLREKSGEMQTFLKETLPGIQGVLPDRLMVDLMRYVRMMTHQALYSSGFYTDSLPDGGNITVFREVGTRIDGN